MWFPRRPKLRRPRLPAEVANLNTHTANLKTIVAQLGAERPAPAA